MLDRAIQLQILQALAAKYPEAAFNVLRDAGIDEATGIANLFYLNEHKLVTTSFTKFGKDPMALAASSALQLPAWTSWLMMVA